jgi:hypothetical protein
VFFPPIHPPPHAQAALDRQESCRPSLDTGKGAREVQGMLLHSLGRCRQAAVGIGPAPDQKPRVKGAAGTLVTSTVQAARASRPALT